MLERLKRSAIAAAALLMLFALPVRAAQDTVVLPATGPMSMGTFVTNHLNPALLSMGGCFSGNTPPAVGPGSAPIAYQLWCDTSAAPTVTVKIYDGTQFVAIGSLDTSTHAYSVSLSGSPFTTLGNPTSSTGAMVPISQVELAQQPYVGSSAVISPTVAGNLNDWAPTGVGDATVIRANPTGAFSVTGIAGGTDGRILLVRNVNASNALTLANESASSLAVNRLAISADWIIQPGSSVALIYDGTSSRWRAYTRGQAWDSDLQAIAALAGSGFAVRPGSDNWVQRSIAGTANQIAVANGDGASGNPTLSLPAAVNIATSLAIGGCTIGSDGFCVTGAVTASASVITGGDFYLSRVSYPWGYIVRPNSVGFKKIGFAVNGGGQLEDVYFDSLRTTASGVVTVNSATTATTGKLTVYGNGTINTGRPTGSGDLVIFGNSGGETSTTDGGLEFVNRSTAPGWGWRFKAPDLTAGNTPLILSQRSSSATWTEAFRWSAGSLITHSMLANNVTGYTMKRATDTSPTGNFVDYQSAAGASLFRVNADGNVAVGGWFGSTIGVAKGGTGADLSATGGASQVLKQVSVGAGVTVGTLACSDLSNDGAGCSASGGNPTATIGLAAVNGSSASYMRADGAPALSQAITPTWTNLHTFTAGATIRAPATFQDSSVTTKQLAFSMASISSSTTRTVTWPDYNLTPAALNVEDQTLTGGARVTSKTLTPGAITVDCGDRPLQNIFNEGAFALTAPANDGSCIVDIINKSGAGAVTFAGFRQGSSSGDAVTTGNAGTATITVTIASPGVVTWTAHGLPNNVPVYFATTGALPTGLTAGTVYYTKSVTTNTFELSATPGGASINTSGSQSGTQSGFAAAVFSVHIWRNNGVAGYRVAAHQ